MHEISLVENIIEIIMAEMPGHGVARVESITLRIGEMQQVVPDTLLFAFDILSKDTPLEGAEVIIEDVPIRGHCRICGQDFAVEDWIARCPECEKMDVEIISGRELDIVEFTGS